MRVDDNLQKIRSTIESKLYNYWGLAPSDLQNIVEVTDGSSKQYRLEYLTKDSIISKRSWAFTDTVGNVKNVLHFK